MALAQTVVVLKNALKINRLDYKQWTWASRVLQPIIFSSFTICRDVTSGCSGSSSILFSLDQEPGCDFRGKRVGRLLTSWASSLWHYDTLKRAADVFFAAVTHGVLQGVTRPRCGVFSGSKECVFSPTKESDRQTDRQTDRRREDVSELVMDSNLLSALTHWMWEDGAEIVGSSVVQFAAFFIVCARLFCEVSFQSDRLLFWSQASIYEDVTHIFQQTH